jgi:2-phosphosulfolactate phosphatase
MKIHITLTASDIRQDNLVGKVAVVIDVLRATSVIITALAHGAEWVKTVESVEDARSRLSPGVLLGGERFALPIEGFDFSNSPLEYTAERVNGKGIILTTTNGTLAISKCGDADQVLAGAFLNQQALTYYLLMQDKPVELICAGTNGEFSQDDFLCAGMICSSMRDQQEIEFDDLGKLAINTWKLAETNVHAALSATTHYNVLKHKGFDADLDYCLSPDLHEIIVRMDGGKFHRVQ